MNIPKTVAKIRFKYHANMLDICNVANQLGILKDDKAEVVMKNHTMQCVDCMRRMYGDKKVDDLFKEEIES